MLKRLEKLTFTPSKRVARREVQVWCTVPKACVRVPYMLWIVCLFQKNVVRLVIILYQLACM